MAAGLVVLYAGGASWLAVLAGPASVERPLGRSPSPTWSRPSSRRALLPLAVRAFGPSPLTAVVALGAAEDQEVLKRQERLGALQPQAGAGGFGLDRLDRNPFGRGRSWSRVARPEVHDAEPPAGFQRPSQVTEQRHPIFDLVHDADDQHGVERADRQVRIAAPAEHRPDVAAALRAAPGG